MSEQLRTPDEWMAVKYPGHRIMDPDGWRQPNSPPFDQPITEAEFDRRLPYCTIDFGAPVPSENQED